MRVPKSYMPSGGWHNTDEIREANESNAHHWFDAGTMGFFKSRASWDIYGGRYFVSSEQQPAFDGHVYPRTYTVREADTFGFISSASALGEFSTRARAVSAAKRYAREGVDHG